MHSELLFGRAAFHGGLLLLLFHAAPAECATESIEFVGEHLAEIAMDNRFASLPLWAPDVAASHGWRFTAQAAVAQTDIDSLAIDGPMFSLGATRWINDDWRLVGLAFLDDLSLSVGIERRPLEVNFTQGVPLSLPAPAEFTGLSGAARNIGLGFAVRRTSSLRLWHSYEWTAGVIWQRVKLRDYSFNFQILSGPDSDATGVIDYSANYSFITPFFGIAWPREHGNWTLTPHLQAAVPLPRQGFVGRISGSGYDLRGDTSVNSDKPFGDPSLTIGLDFTYRPWNLTVDVGSAVSQAVLEPLIHEGVNRNWLISASWSF